MTTPRMLLVLRRLDPRSKMQAGDSASGPDLAIWSLWRTRLPVKVYSEALGCSQWISPCIRPRRFLHPNNRGVVTHIRESKIGTVFSSS